MVLLRRRHDQSSTQLCLTDTNVKNVEEVRGLSNVYNRRRGLQPRWLGVLLIVTAV